jgi:phage terminase small subunit
VIDISQRIALLKEKRNKRVELTSDQVLVELKRIAFSNICDLKIDWDKVKDWNDLTDDQKAVIAEIKVTEAKGKDWTKTVTEIKMHDKLKALESIAKHIGLYEKDNQQKQVPVINLNLIDSTPRIG